MKKKTILQYFILIFFAVCLFAPLYIMFVMSFKDETQIIQNFWAITFPLHFNNYVEAWKTISIYYLNSFKVTFLTVAGILLVSTLAGYAFAKLEFKFKETLFYSLMAFKMIPVSLMLIPMFITITQMSLNDNHFGVILPGIATSSIVAVLLSRGFFEAIPDSIFESARMEGASEITVLVHIVIPLSKPILGTIAIFNFFSCFNAYMWPYLVLSTDRLKTIPIGLARLAGQYGVNFGFQMAGYSLAAIPVIIVFLCTSKIYISGITAGAIKA